MFDLHRELSRWRREAELTLAFEPEELDELEDHLKLTVEKAVATGASPEDAWKTAIARLGEASPLALEFTKNKLLPALLHLLQSWWRAGLLLAIFLFEFISAYSLSWYTAPDRPSGMPHYLFWIIAWFSFVVLLLLLPGRTAKNALLLGTGLAFCFIPPLSFVAYNSFVEHLIGPGWQPMGAGMGWWPLTISLIGFVGLVFWCRKHTPREKFITTLTIVAAIILVLTIAPFLGEFVGNLSLRVIFNLPTAHEIPYTGDTLTKYLQWKFVDVLLDNCLIVINWIPLTLALAISGGIILLQTLARRWKQHASKPEEAFPSRRDMPWIYGLIGSGLAWAMAAYVEPSFYHNYRQTEIGVHRVTDFPIGIMLMIWPSVLAFILCSYELTRRLWQTKRARPFYAALIVLQEVLILDPTSLMPSGQEIIPAILFINTILIFVLAGIMTTQMVLIWKKFRRGDVEPSIWKFDSGDLVRFGASLGLIGACAGLFFVQVALVLAFVSVTMIAALLQWSNSIAHPDLPYNPSHFFNPATNLHYPAPHLSFWIYSGLDYFAFCFIVGFSLAIILSGLEFIRFNAYRYYKVRHAERKHRVILAINE